MKSGFVSLVGRPNVGKSTLLNSLVGAKIAITADKPQTTRNNIQGIYNDSDSQIIFIDTPGIHKPKHKLGVNLNKQAYFSISDVDVILFLVDVTNELGLGDKFIINKLKESRKPVILILNKIDKIPKEKILNKIVEYKDLHEFSEIIPVSALKKANVDLVLNVLKKYLTDNIKYYDDDFITNRTNEFLVSEIIREKIIHLTDEEVPHSVMCIVESFKINKDKAIITALIVVDRKNLKGMIIGKQGQMVKKIGILARKDIEELLNKKVYLELLVKVVPKWRDKEHYLNENIFKEFE